MPQPAAADRRLRRRWPDQALYVLGPCRERRLLLGEILELIVDLRDAGDLPARVVEDFVDHMRRNPERCHSGSGRAAQIVKREGRHLFAPHVSHSSGNALPAAPEAADGLVAAPARY